METGTVKIKKVFQDNETICENPIVKLIDESETEWSIEIYTNSQGYQVWTDNGLCEVDPETIVNQIAEWLTEIYPFVFYGNGVHESVEQPSVDYTISYE